MLSYFQQLFFYQIPPAQTLLFQLFVSLTSVIFFSGQASGIISKAFYNALQPVVSAGQTKKIAYRDLYESFLQANIIEWNEVTSFRLI